jgi:hypothetical protein
MNVRDKLDNICHWQTFPAKSNVGEIGLCEYSPRAQYYQTFYGRKLQIFLIRWRFVSG